MREVIPPLANTPPLRGAQLKHRVRFTFTFTCDGMMMNDD